MPRFEVKSPDGRVFDVNAPEGATQADAIAYVQAQLKGPKEAPADPMQGIGTGQRVLEGIGQGMTNLGRGIGQRLGMVSEADVEAARKVDAPLLKTGGGTVGSAIGSVVGAAPTLMIPGANTVGGAAAVGSVIGALQPTAKGESVVRNAVEGGALGGAGQYGLGKIAGALGGRLAEAEAAGALAKSQNAVRDEAIAASKDIGYKTIPSVSGGNFVGRTLEGLTGKEKASQLAAVSNQDLTNTLARKAFGLSPDTPLSHETMKGVRAEAAQKGYEPVRAVKRVKTDSKWQQDVNSLTSRADSASKDFGELVKSDIKPLADALNRVESFSGSGAVDQISLFREAASDLYAQGNKSLGKAYRQAAEAIEAQVERGLAKSGKDGAAMIKDFREARTKMAQSFDMEKALREGQGSIDAKVLGRMFDKNPGRMTGEMAQIGRAAAAMPDVMGVPKSGWANPVTALDSGFGSIGGILAGNPLPLMYPVARAAGRYGLMSGAGQKAMTTPSYGPGLTQKAPALTLEELRRLGVGGLLGTYAE